MIGRSGNKLKNIRKLNVNVCLSNWGFYTHQSDYQIRHYHALFMESNKRKNFLKAIRMFVQNLAKKDIIGQIQVKNVKKYVFFFECKKNQKIHFFSMFKKYPIFLKQLSNVFFYCPFL